MWRPVRILFLCVANSARSQMAHYLAEKHYGPSAEILSAGSHPTKPHPIALEVLREVGCDPSDASSDLASDIEPGTVDVVITLCADEVCPVFLSKVERHHWPFPDPAVALENEMAVRQQFRTVRDGIEQKILEFGRERKLTTH